MSLSERIGAFGGLVGLVLALITLLTANRAERLKNLAASARVDASAALREMIFNSALAAITLLLLLAGLPLWIDAVGALHPLADDGPLTGVFILTWALLLPLIGWQVALAHRALALRRLLARQGARPSR